eukprot:3349972-Pyramimonas_sp.AAC.1
MVAAFEGLGARSASTTTTSERPCPVDAKRDQVTTAAARRQLVLLLLQVHKFDIQRVPDCARPPR